MKLSSEEMVHKQAGFLIKRGPITSPHFVAYERRICGCHIGLQYQQLGFSDSKLYNINLLQPYHKVGIRFAKNLASTTNGNTVTNM